MARAIYASALYVAPAGGDVSMQRAVAKKATKKPEEFLDPEGLFWEWVTQCVTPKGWIRYHPEIARALNSDRAALVLASAIHLDGRGSGIYSAGRWFYKSASEWANDLAMGQDSFKAALGVLVTDWPDTREIRYSVIPDKLGRVDHRREPTRSFGFIHRWLASSDPGRASAVYHYRVNWRALIEWWTAQSEEYGQIPLALQLTEKPLTSEWKNPLLVNGKTLNRLTEKPLTSLEDIQKKTSLEDIPSVVDDAPADAGNENQPLTGNPRILYRILIRNGIAPVTAWKLIDELAGIPISYIDALLDHINSEQADTAAGKRRSTIRNWPAFKVSSLRSLVDQSREGLLEKYMQSFYGITARENCEVQR
jgi:hypothetical protein